MISLWVAGAYTDVILSATGRSYLSVPATTAAGSYYVFVQVRHMPPSVLTDPTPGNDYTMRTGTIIVVNPNATNSDLAAIKYMRINKSDGTSVLIPISEIKEIIFNNLVGIKDLEKWNAVFNEFTKLKCYPNPTNSAVTIEYNLPEIGQANLMIYNNSGALIYKKALENQIVGLNQITWSGTDNDNISLPNGVYHCCILFKNTKLQEKIIILK